MSESTDTKFDQWALVELMGRQRAVGRVTEQTLAGAAFIRVDVPDAQGNIRFGRLYSPQAVYAISPITKDVAIRLAQEAEIEPVKAYELPAHDTDRDAQAGYDPEGQDEEDDAEFDLRKFGPSSASKTDQAKVYGQGDGAVTDGEPR